MIQLVPMNEKEYQNYLSFAIADYAEDHVKGGRWKIAMYEKLGYIPTNISMSKPLSPQEP